MYECLFFDLDGTLADTEEGILLSLQYALSKMGITESDNAVLHSFIGPPLKDAFISHYNMDEPTALRALAYYREFYADKGIYRCRLFDGIEELLRRLRAAGRRLFVATSKPEVYAGRILRHLGVDELFEEIAGSLLDNTRSKKHEVIQHLLDKYPEAAGSVLMIGDKHQDLDGAAHCGIPAVGVLYGYGSREELSRGSSIALVRDPEELYRLLVP